MPKDNELNNQEVNANFEDIIDNNQEKNNADKDNIEEEKIEKKSKKKSFKGKVILIETIVLIVVLAVSYLYYNNQREKRQEVNNSYEQLQVLKEELSECQNLIAQDQVNPGEYDYCRLLLRKF